MSKHATEELAFEKAHSLAIRMKREVGVWWGVPKPLSGHPLDRAAMFFVASIDKPVNAMNMYFYIDCVGSYYAREETKEGETIVVGDKVMLWPEGDSFVRGLADFLKDKVGTVIEVDVENRPRTKYKVQFKEKWSAYGDQHEELGSNTWPAYRHDLVKLPAEEDEWLCTDAQLINYNREVDNETVS